MLSLSEFITTTKAIVDEEIFEMPDSYYGGLEYEELLRKYKNYNPPETNIIIQPCFSYMFFF